MKNYPADVIHGLEHSWLLDKQGRTVETTEPRVVYFGVSYGQ